MEKDLCHKVLSVSQNVGIGSAGITRLVRLNMQHVTKCARTNHPNTVMELE